MALFVPRTDFCAEICSRVAYHKPSDVSESTGGGSSHEPHWWAVLMGS